MKELLRAFKSLAGPFPAFDRDGAPDDPADLFSTWLGAAIDAAIKEPHAMTLSTVDERGFPDARIVILKNLDARGWHFATTCVGPKGKQIATNPEVALTFYWPQLGRQIRVRGLASRLEVWECEADFLARARGARASTLAGRQSEIIRDDGELDDELARRRAHLFEDSTIITSDWIVYAVAPVTVEFWQGDTERRHKRLRYRQEAGVWVKERLWP